MKCIFLPFFLHCRIFSSIYIYLVKRKSHSFSTSLTVFFFCANEYLCILFTRHVLSTTICVHHLVPSYFKMWSTSYVVLPWWSACISFQCRDSSSIFMHFKTLSRCTFFIFLENLWSSYFWTTQLVEAAVEVPETGVSHIRSNMFHFKLWISSNETNRVECIST